MTIQEVYEKYKHLDKLLCNPRWGNLDEGFLMYLLYNFWQAIKIEGEKKG